METMRKTGELKFNPIRFTSSYISGSPGKKSFDEFFRSPLTQNLCYCVRNTAKTVQEIADELGVSPVYVEGEVEFLAEYGFLLEEKGKYIANFIIEESTSELLTLRDSMYKQAAVPFANELFDELTSSGILDDPAIVCHQTDESLTANMHPKADRNFLLWSLLPFAAAWSGEHLMEEKVSFEEAATIRPDGGHYIFHAVVQPESLVLPDDYVHMRNWNGPMWQRNGRQAIWQVDSDWSGREPSGERDVPNELRRTLNLYNAFKEGTASKSDIAWLAERGYVKVAGDCRYAWQIVLLESSEIRRKLLAVGDRLKEKYKAEFDRIKAAFVEAELRATPKHLRKQKEYTQQHIFHSDGMFLLHCITALLQSGKLHPPTEGQRKALTTVIFNM